MSRGLTLCFTVMVLHDNVKNESSVRASVKPGSGVNSYREHAQRSSVKWLVFYSTACYAD